MTGEINLDTRKLLTCLEWEPNGNLSTSVTMEGASRAAKRNVKNRDYG
jgi:hypothetical protein